jgi:hypothetical protein
MKDLYAKKYTLLMNDEPLTIWIKNNQIKKSLFMDKKVQLDLDLESIKKIQDFPTRVINGNNFSDDLSFTKSVSKMMSQKLEIAIAKNDKKTLSRFARSKLVPENMKDNFIEAINRPRGLRGVLVRAVNKTNAIFKNLAHKIDRFFDKVKDRVANKKLDKYLVEYQLKEFNKAPPIKDIDIKKHINPKLLDMAEEFVKKNNILDLTDTKTQDKLLQNEFLTQAARNGLNAVDAKTALAKVLGSNQYQKDFFENESKLESFEITIKNLESKLEFYASKNETLEDYQIISKDAKDMDKVDLLLANAYYQAAGSKTKDDIENKYLFNQEPALERAIEAKEISKVISKEPQFETVYKRDVTVNFSSQGTKDEISKTWSELQKINSKEQAQNRNFMNINAVKFAGVSKQKLESWQAYAVSKGADKDITQKYVYASLRNATALFKAGILTQPKEGEFKFKDQFAKEVLFKNLDKPVAELEQLNKGEKVKIEINPTKELTQRVESISSEKSFEDLKNDKGEIDADKLLEYGQKLERLALSIKENANNKAVTREDLQKADRASENQKVVGAENVRG